FDNPEEINVGDEVEVLLERLENDQGMVVLSKQKASQRQNWSKIVKLFEAEGIIKGRVKSVVKGGLIVNVGVEAFLPASQVDINPPKDLTQFVGNTYDFKIVKINEDRKNVVLSRRELIEAERSERRQQFLGTMSAGDKVEGTVKNITDFGAFLDLDGIDGLLHITDMSWARLSHPSEAVKPGDRLTVVVLEINKDKERISLGLKQLQSNPWDRLEERFPIGQKIKGKVTNLMPYGAFVQIEEGIEGLIHVSELSWTKRITRPSDVLTLGQDIEAVVLGVNKEDQKISLGVRQLEPNPWDEIEQRYVIGKQVRGQVRNMTAYGAFVELEEGIDGMVHVSDLSWTKKINHPSEILKKGDEIDAVVIDIDKANQRISLGVKQIETDPWKEIEGRVEKVKDVLKPGQEVEARVIKIDKTERRLGLSIKATGYSEEALRKESEALESVKSGEDMVSFGAALTAAEEEYRPGQGTK
ncbi:MAG: 30S ribosomal protein S1, partial [Verrucomicrobia bacterium]|nr:30S ribosomal protein S1 [Verrucomicrobiota bacterium]